MTMTGLNVSLHERQAGLVLSERAAGRQTLESHVPEKNGSPSRGQLGAA